jgi:hypothetical protein
MKLCGTCNKKIKKSSDRHLDCSICRDVEKERICTKCNKTFIGTRNKCALCKSRIDRERLLKRADGHKLLASISAKRRCKLKQAIPQWSDLDRIKEFYLNCPNGMVVDHIIPINNFNVSGLHVSWNLQYLENNLNIIKSNKFDFTYENNSWRKDIKNVI